MKNELENGDRTNVVVCESLGKISGSYGETEFFVFSNEIRFGESW